MDYNTERDVEVKYGVLPLSWSIIGTGFSLQYPTATGRTNTIIADGTAGGCCTVTIVDALDVNIKCLIRCTRGYWKTSSSKAFGTCSEPMTENYAQVNTCLRWYWRAGPLGTGTDWTTPYCGFFDQSEHLDGNENKACYLYCEGWSVL